MNGRRLLAVLTVLSLSLAGCTAPVSPPNDAEVAGNSSVADGEAAADGETAAGADGETASNDGADAGDDADDGTERSLPIEPDPVWNRVATMMDTDAEQPELTVGVPSATAGQAFATDRSTFKQALNASAAGSISDGGAGPRGVTTPFGVYVEPADGPPVVVEQVLAHEYAHAVQYSESMFGAWLIEPTGSTDRQMTKTALIEGGATYVGDEYTERHLSDVPLQSEQMRRSYERSASGDRFFVAPYYFGAEYVDERLDTPANLQRVYADPPATTAELLHGESAGEQLAMSISVDTEDSDWTATSRDRKGELFTRIALRATLDNDTAAAAAAGWGNDSAIAFDSDGRGDPEAFVWTFRWQTSGEADEFVAAFEESLDRRTDDWADRTRVERVGDRTVAIAMGPDEFREGTAISESDGDVTVDVDARVEDDGWFRVEAGPATTGAVANGGATTGAAAAS
ncbi:hypothetical protein [Natronoarchaeum mannanilyticum]|uniref:Lipoprotein n=1 Tax=Natronoarchaeum mannanilyticum TaxID=926360 RepID=A0AAV3T4V7_9EURY